MIGEAMVPKWLDVDWLLSQFGSYQKSAIESCCRFVLEGKGLPSPLAQTRHQLLLGDDAFIERHPLKNSA
jgi:putative transposase